jgi:hypothetical protein
MLKLLTLTALASALVLATAAAPEPASAFGYRGTRAMVHVGGPRYHFSHQYKQSRFIYRPHHPWHRWHHHHWHRYGWGWGVPVAMGVAGVATYAATAPAPACTCLTKQYLDNGAVLFTDTCTNESAMAMPPVGAPK